MNESFGAILLEDCVYLCYLCFDAPGHFIETYNKLRTATAISRSHSVPEVKDGRH